jgi:hypothetical protein
MTRIPALIRSQNNCSYIAQTVPRAAAFIRRGTKPAAVTEHERTDILGMSTGVSDGHGAADGVSQQDHGVQVEFTDELRKQLSDEER